MFIIPSRADFIIYRKQRHLNRDLFSGCHKYHLRIHQWRPLIKIGTKKRVLE